MTDRDRRIEVMLEGMLEAERIDHAALQQALALLRKGDIADAPKHDPETENDRDKQLKSFKESAEPLIKWLCENVDPHHTVIVTQTSAELLQGSLGTGPILDHVKD